MFSFYKVKANEKFFILINNMQGKLKYNYKLMSEFFCNEKYGIGANRLVILEKSEIADFKMKIFDSKGNEKYDMKEGIKCLSRYFYEHCNYEMITVETINGIQEIIFKLDEENKIILNINNTYIDVDAIELFEGRLNI